MTDFEKRIPDVDPMIEEWPNPDDDSRYYATSDEYIDYDDYEDDAEEPKDYLISFKLTGLSEEEIGWLSRHFFDVAANALAIHRDKFEDLDIQED